MTGIILAAGLGTRLRPFTEHTPKPLFPVKGRPLLAHSIDALVRCGCDSILINTHHLHEMIESYIRDLRLKIPVHLVFEPEILGTGGAIKNMAPFLDSSPFFIVNGDIFFDVDLKRLLRFHESKRGLAAIILVKNSETDSVMLGRDSSALCFRSRNASGTELFTFSGIHLVEPEICEMIPGGHSDIIEAYERAIEKGFKIFGMVEKSGKWADIGNPQRYRRLVLEENSAFTFKKAFGVYFKNEKIDTLQLQGDGSNRKWFRLRKGNKSMIIADHGIRRSRKTEEVDSFIRIGRHLLAKGIRVPEIYFADPFSGFVFMEDLGDENLQSFAMQADDEKRYEIYTGIIDDLLLFSKKGAAGFNTAWCYDTPVYDVKFVIERECLYFADYFLKLCCGTDPDMDALLPEFKRIAQRAAIVNDRGGLMHRDMQSRNIMIKGGVPYFIDFQGARIGPVEYDIASLLIDPYVGLDAVIRDELVKYAAKRAKSVTGTDPATFESRLFFCALARNLQILGAFANLSICRKKSWFTLHIPPAVNSLKGLLKDGRSSSFYNLKTVLDRLDLKKGG